MKSWGKALATATLLGWSVLTAADPIKFIVVGDTQGSGNAGVEPFVPQLISDIEARNPEFVLFTGDLVGTGTTATFANWAALTQGLGDSRIMVPGNHDLPGRPATNGDWQSAFAWLPDSQVVPNITTANPVDTIKGIDKMDYYIDVAPNIRIISVTTDRDPEPGETANVLGGEPPALDWFKSVMALPETKAKQHVFVITHHPVTTYMGGPHQGTPSSWWKTISGTNNEFDGAVADAIFTGHVHAYMPNQPDPHSHTNELVIGTGGGGSEGVPHRHLHGFLEVTVHDNGDVTAEFYGDKNESFAGWSFTDILDSFTITKAAGEETGQIALYQFESGAKALDSSSDVVSKGHSLRFNGGAKVVNDSQRGSVLALNGNSQFADVSNASNQNFQVLSDLSIELWVKAAALGDESVDNVLVAFGEADGATTTNGVSPDSAYLFQEAANYAYQLRYTNTGHLEISWQFHDDPGAGAKLETLTSSEPVAALSSWNKVGIIRDAETRRLRFLLNGAPLGNDFSFRNLPTGGGFGSFYIGALPNIIHGNDGGVATFNGLIDDVSINSSAVSLPPEQGPTDPTAANTACFYDDVAWEQLLLCTGVGQAAFSAAADDKVSAISVGAGVHSIIYDGNNQTGRLLCVDSDSYTSALADMNNRASSYEIAAGNCPDNLPSERYKTYSIGRGDLLAEIEDENIQLGSLEIPWEVFPVEGTTDQFYIRNKWLCEEGDSRCDQWFSFGGTNVKLFAGEADRVPWKLIPVEGEINTFYFQNKWRCDSGESRCDYYIALDGNNLVLTADREQRTELSIFDFDLPFTPVPEEEPEPEPATGIFPIVIKEGCPSSNVCDLYVEFTDVNIRAGSTLVNWEFIGVEGAGDQFYIRNKWNCESGDSRCDQWFSFGGTNVRLYAGEADKVPWRLYPVAGQADTYIFQNKWRCDTGESRCDYYVGLDGTNLILVTDVEDAAALSMLDFDLIASPVVEGDLDGNGILDVTDRNMLRAALGQCEGDAGYDVAADLDSDGCVSMQDYRAWSILYRNQ